MAACCLLTDPTPHSPTTFNHPSTPASSLENERSGSTSSPTRHSFTGHPGETSLLPGLDSTQAENQPSNFQYSTDKEDHLERGEPTPKGEKNEDKESRKPKPYPESQYKTILEEVGPKTRASSIDSRKEVNLSRESGNEAKEPMTVGQLFKYAKGRFPEHPALKYKENGQWKTYTYTEYYRHCIKAAKSFLEVRVGNTVVFWEKNRLHVLASQSNNKTRKSLGC